LSYYFALLCPYGRTPLHAKNDRVPRTVINARRRAIGQRDGASHHTCKEKRAELMMGFSQEQLIDHLIIVITAEAILALVEARTHTAALLFRAIRVSVDP